MANDGRACLQASTRAATRLRSPTRRGLFGGALILLAASVAACTTGSVLSLEPAVDVGSSTAAVPRIETPVQPSVETAAVMPPTTGLQTLVPSDPYLVGYPRMDPPVAPQMEVRPTTCRRKRSTAAAN